MSEQQEIELISAFGDGWYDGFLAAQKEQHELLENEDGYIDYNDSEVLQMSEHAESQSPRPKRDKWLKTCELPPSDEKIFYWVYVPSEELVIMARFNDYKQYGGQVNYWQDLRSNDFDMAGTLYQPINEPTAPNK